MVMNGQQIRLRSQRFKHIDCIGLIDNNGLSKVSIDTKFTTIIASGKHGIDGWEFIQKEISREDNTILAVNYAVTFWEQFGIEYIRPDLWCVTDTRAVGQVVPPETTPWFPGALHRHLAEGRKAIFNMAVVEKAWSNLGIGGPYYTFICKKLMRYPGDVRPHPSLIRPGGTVTCSATQVWDKIATHPDRVLLICGADLSGDAYAKGYNKTKKHGVVWKNSVDCLGAMIKFLNKDRKQVYVISKSMLQEWGRAEYYPGSERYITDESSLLAGEAPLPLPLVPGISTRPNATLRARRRASSHIK